MFNISCQNFKNKNTDVESKKSKFKPRYYGITIKFGPHDGDALHM
jgi:hypothetical protein